SARREARLVALGKPSNRYRRSSDAGSSSRPSQQRKCCRKKTRSIAILQAEISRLATRFARYALSTQQLAAPEQLSPHEYGNRVGTKMPASAAIEGETERRNRRSRARKSREDSRFCAEPGSPRRDPREIPNHDQPPSER